MPARILSRDKGWRAPSSYSHSALVKQPNAIWVFFLLFFSFLQMPSLCSSWQTPSSILSLCLAEASRHHLFSSVFLFFSFLFSLFFLFSFFPLFSPSAIFALPLCLPPVSAHDLHTPPLTHSREPISPQRELLHTFGTLVCMSRNPVFVAMTWGTPP